MLFVKSVRPAAVTTAIIAAIAPKDLNINDAGECPATPPPVTQHRH